MAPEFGFIFKQASEISSGRRREVTFERTRVGTVAILAQGTNRGDALCAALFFRTWVRVRHSAYFLRNDFDASSPPAAKVYRIGHHVPKDTCKDTLTFAYGHTLRKTPDPI